MNLLYLSAQREFPRRHRRLTTLLLLTSVLACSVFTLPVAAEPDPVVELKERQKKVRALVDSVMPCVVALRSANQFGEGSGVIVSKDGLILTAGHVTEATGEKISVIFPDGKMLQAEALGSNLDRDAGMARITVPGEYPFAPVADAESVTLGQWCVVMGHPGGYDSTRGIPLRVGRVLRKNEKGFLVTDCTLAAGDSGGPLFNLEGEVIGINSSISGSLAHNMHVAADAFQADWDRLVKGDEWGDISTATRFGPSDLGNYSSRPKNRAMLGALLSRKGSEGVRVKQILPSSPAKLAGLQDGDIIIKFGEEDVADYDGLMDLLGKSKPGEKVILSVKRGEALLDLEVELGDREDKKEEK